MHGAGATGRLPERRLMVILLKNQPLQKVLKIYAVYRLASP